MLCFEHVMLVSLYFMIRDIFYHQEKPEKKQKSKMEQIAAQEDGKNLNPAITELQEQNKV